MGGNKPREIQQHPILSWYAQVFDELLQRENTRLMVIGYGFRDVHINGAIAHAVHDRGLQIFNISPHGGEQARSLNETRNRRQIIVGTSIEDVFEKGLIGASRRPLSHIFGGDMIEHNKVQRFFEG